MKKLFILSFLLFGSFQGFSDEISLTSSHKKQEQSGSDTIINDPKLPMIAIVTTGGTIAEKTDPKTGASVPALSGKDLINSVPLIKKIANVKVVNFSNIDSSQMTPDIWRKLSVKVDEILSDSKIIGAVITHGTDTMSEGSYFLDLTLKSRKNVVFTGAMRNSSDPYTDGPPNLLNAVVQVCAKEAKNWGVTVTLNQYVNSARDVEKTQTTNVQTFESGEKGYLGYINEGKVYRFNNRLYETKVPLPKKLANVVLFTDYAGATGSFIYNAVDKDKIDGLVIESVGSGNVNADVFEAVQYALKKNVVVVITSRVFYGSVFPEYGDKGGGKTLQEAGAIVCGNLKGPKARVLLMLLIPNYGKNVKNLEKYFNKP